METEVQVMHGIPDEQVASKVIQLQALENYISHQVIPEGNGRNTIEVTVRKNNPAPTTGGSP